MNPKSTEDLRLYRAAFLSALAAIYIALIFLIGRLSPTPVKDEVHFWPVVLHFSSLGWPTLEDLRDYRSLATPLVFIVFGAVERLFHGGLQVARLLNAALSLAIITAVGLPTPANSRRRLLAAVGLLSFPYYLGTSIYLYTDILAAALVLGGLVSYLRDRPVLSCIGFTLAIACRQYMVAFPMGTILWELWRYRASSDKQLLVASSVACLSLLFWWWMFGGVAPRGGLAVWSPETSQATFVRPQSALYFLSCVGFYFVIPETILLRRRIHDWHRVSIAGVAVTFGLLTVALFAVFPPLANVQGLPTMGFLDRGAHMLMPDVLRVISFAILALLVVVRFGRPSLASFLLLTNAFVLSKAHIAWDKYALAYLVVLWFLLGEGLLPGQSTTAGQDWAVERRTYVG